MSVSCERLPATPQPEKRTFARSSFAPFSNLKTGETAPAAFKSRLMRWSSSSASTPSAVTGSLFGRISSDAEGAVAGIEFSPATYTRPLGLVKSSGERVYPSLSSATVRALAAPLVEACTPIAPPEIPAKTASAGRGVGEEEGLRMMEWPGRFVRGISGRERREQRAADQGPAAMRREEAWMRSGVVVQWGRIESVRMWVEGGGGGEGDGVAEDRLEPQVGAPCVERATEERWVAERPPRSDVSQFPTSYEQ